MKRVLNENKKLRNVYKYLLKTNVKKKVSYLKKKQTKNNTMSSLAPPNIFSLCLRTLSSGSNKAFITSLNHVKHFQI